MNPSQNKVARASPSHLDEVEAFQVDEAQKENIVDLEQEMQIEVVPSSGVPSVAPSVKRYPFDTYCFVGLCRQESDNWGYPLAYGLFVFCLQVLLLTLLVLNTAVYQFSSTRPDDGDHPSHRNS